MIKKLCGGDVSHHFILTLNLSSHKKIKSIAYPLTNLKNHEINPVNFSFIQCSHRL